MKTKPKKTKKPASISKADWEDVTSPPLSAALLETMRPAKEMLPKAMFKTLKEGRVGRPPLEQKKRAISIRIDENVLAAFRATGRGWQARMHEVLRQHMPNSYNRSD